MKIEKKYFAILIATTFMIGCLNGCSQKEKRDTVVQELTIKSDILGMGDTGNKTSLKKDLIYTSGPGDINLYHYDKDGNRVIYDNQKSLSIHLDPVRYKGSAVLNLGDGIDDSLIDSSKAKVKLIDGNSYHADELILASDSLKGTWSKGQYVYTLKEGDLEWNTWGYDTTKDYNSGREWSIMGGDGNGVYYFTLEVSGIKYNGKEVGATTFPVAVYIYGRSCTDLALATEFTPNTYDTNYSSGDAQTDQVQWKWVTENKDAVVDGKPYMNDNYSDYFSAIWPKGVDASKITADDVKVTLCSKYGDKYTLSTKNAYGEEEYAVVANKNETEVVVTYQQWALIPVYSTMEITINKGDLTTTKTYDISSVAAYLVQTGGGGVTVDHTVTCYNYYGVLGLSLDNAANTGYTLSTNINGKTYYYAEDTSGKAYLSEGVEKESPFGKSVSAPKDAWVGDATEKYNIDVYGNVVFSETRLENTQDKKVDGVTYTFTENVSVTRDISEMITNGAHLDDGFNLQKSSAAKWAWTKRYQSGWTTSTPQPTGLPYIDGYYGYGYKPGSSNPIYDKLSAKPLAG